jgi:hypothetical protein
LLWALCARKQKDIQTLKNATHFTYESPTENTESCVQLILQVVPELISFDIEISMRVRSIFSRSLSKIRNLNNYKISKLTNKQVNHSNDVLKNYNDLMEYFGYEYIDASLMRRFQRNITLSVANSKTTLEKIRNKLV